MALTHLRRKLCLITGAASGIGRATALGAAAEGARLVLTDIQSAALDAVVDEIRLRGGEVACAKAFDISDVAAVQSFAAEVHDAHGSVDVLMNIAGISIWGAVDVLEHRHWRKVIEVNLMGPIHVLSCFVPAMIRDGRGGHIVNVSSAAGLFGLPWHAAYSASKFGLRGISEVLRFDLERHGIGVSLVCPGGVRTSLVSTVEILGVDPNAKHLQAMRKQFERHAVSPEVAAHAILQGIKRNRYLVFTSNDIRVGYFLQQKLPFAYNMVMRKLNQQLQRMRDPRVADATHKGASHV